MAGMGPPPKEPGKRARQNPTVAMTCLPAEGRKGRAPAWPLDADLATETAIHDTKRQIKAIEDELAWATTSRDRSAQRRKLERAKKHLAERQAMKVFLARNEKKLWAALWKTPQATQWQKLGWTREVAQYVRHKVKAEGGSLDDAKEARQQADRLGLTPMSLLRLRWEIGDKASRSTGGPRGAKKSGSRARRGHLMAVPDAKASGE